MRGQQNTKNVEIDKYKHTKKKLYTKLALFTRLCRDALSTKHKIPALISLPPRKFARPSCPYFRGRKLRSAPLGCLPVTQRVLATGFVNLQAPCVLYIGQAFRSL